jgi:hypothetical protein
LSFDAYNGSSALYCYGIFGKWCGIKEGSDTTQMNGKRPYKHLLKNIFHEQATEIIPLLLPEYRIEQVLDVEMPDLKSTSIEGPPGELEQGLVGLALPGARLLMELGRHLTGLYLRP